MQKETANELDTLYGHDSLPVAFSVVAPAEGYGLLVHLHQAMVGEGDSVGVSGQVIEDLFGTRERRLAIDHHCDSNPSNAWESERDRAFPSNLSSPSR